MRILPVSNYNYQSKTQNNKQQNVNFGMLHGSPDDAKRLLKAGFFDVEDAINAIVTKVGVAFRKAPQDTKIRKPLELDDNFTLYRYLKTAREKHAVMSLEEKEAFETLFEQPETDIPTKTFLSMLEADIECSNPVTELMQSKLTELEWHILGLDNVELALSNGLTTEGDYRLLSRAKELYSKRAEAIKQELYAESARI